MVEEKKFVLAGRSLFVAIPAYDGRICIHSAYELPQLALASLKHKFSIHLGHLSGSSIITRARNSLVNQFMESDCTEMLFIDSDIHFKHQDVLRIMALGSDRDVLCGSYPRRAADQKFFTDIHYNEHGGVELTENGLLRVDRIGTGFMFIRRHVIEKLIKDHPEWKYWVNVENKHHYSLFDFKVTPEGYMGEDYLFCDRAAAEGFTVYLDPSICLPHIGSAKFERSFEEDVLKPLLKDHCKPVLKVANG